MYPTPPIPLPAGIRVDPQTQQLSDFLGNYSVFLLTAPRSGDAFDLKLCGSGTLVTVGTEHYVLTAAHVWKEIASDLKARADHLDLAVTPNAPHRFGIPKDQLNFVTSETDSEEWGPDVCFIRLPMTALGYLKATKSFHNLTKRLETPAGDLDSGIWVASGVPSKWGKVDGSSGEFVHITFRFEVEGRRFTHEGYDYIDFDFAESGENSNTPAKFGGVSGGGLWRVEGVDDIIPKLEGVAFYERFANEGTQGLRFHGLETLRRFLPKQG